MSAYCITKGLQLSGYVTVTNGFCTFSTDHFDRQLPRVADHLLRMLRKWPPTVILSPEGNLRLWSMERKDSEALCELIASMTHAGKLIYFSEF